jgi:ankyrin repeat protein
VLVDLLLSAGVSPDAAYQYEDRKSDVLHRISPLFTAVESGNEEMALHLLQKGADPADVTALGLAIESDKASLFRTLLTAFRQSYPAGRSDFEATLLIKAIEKETCPYFEQLLEAKMNVNHLSRRNGRTPLGSVVERHGIIYLEIAARLLESGADPNAIARSYDINALLPLKTALLLAIEAGNEEMVELLLKNGAEVNKEARRGITRTPLQSACQQRSLSIVQLLLRCGANVNAPPSIRNGGTALQLACLSGSIKIVRHLLSVGANVFGPTSAANGRSALENAAENGRLDVIKILWDATGGCGFPATEVARAQRFARARGFPGCAEYVAKLAEASAEASFLQF